jgi:hypothetical protein
MTTLTLITLVVIAYGALNSRGYGRALALGGATAAGAAVVVGTTAVPTFYAVAIGAAIALGVRLLGDRRADDLPRRTLPPGATLLLLFVVWSVFVTLIAPVLFDGMGVQLPVGGANELHATAITNSNIAQIIYLVLGVCVIVFLARTPSAGPGLIGLAAGATTVLSLWRCFHQMGGVPFPDGIFDNSPFFAYIESAPGNVPRFRGILSEPAGLAASSLITIAYMLPRSLQVHGWRRVGTLMVAGAAMYLGAISTSASFVVAAVAVTLIAALTFVFGFLMRRTSLSAVVGVVACALVIAALWVLPIISDFVEATVNDKVLSPSYSERSGADSASYDLFLDTFGFGVGLGANRSSSFLPGLISTTGLIGGLLFAGAVATLIRRAAPVREYRPVIWALVTLLVAKVVSGPDLSDSSGILWISLGLLSQAAMNADARPSFLGGFVRSGTSPPKAVRDLDSERTTDT